jgi:hypothetical protein
MTVVQLPLDPGSQARAILNHVLEHGDIAGRDAVGRRVIALAVDDWLFEWLMTFDAGGEELEDDDSEPDDDAEIDGPPSASDLDTVGGQVIPFRRGTKQERRGDGSPLIPRHAGVLDWLHDYS